jgi:hypothetical protein
VNLVGPVCLGFGDGEVRFGNNILASCAVGMGQSWTNGTDVRVLSGQMARLSYWMPEEVLSKASMRNAREGHLIATWVGVVF